MGVSVKSGTFDLATSTGNQAITGVGFQPKALLLLGASPTGTPGVDTFDRLAYGFVSASAERTFGIHWRGGLTTSYGRCLIAEAALKVPDTYGGTMYEGTLVSFDSDGFTINWSEVTGYRNDVHYLAIGGDDVTNVAVGHFVLSGSSGNQAITGLGFQPDALLMGAVRVAGTLPQYGTYAHLGWSMADASLNQYSMALSGEHNEAAATARAKRQAFDDYFVCGLTGSGATQDYYGTLASMDSDGFTINLVDPPENGNLWSIPYLAIKGGNPKVGTFTGIALSSSTTVTGHTLPPKAAIFAGIGSDYFDTLNEAGDAVFNLGVDDGVTARSLTQGMTTRADPTVGHAITRANSLYDTNPTPSGMTQEGEGKVSSWNSDGFTVSWSDTLDGNAIWGYMTFAEAAVTQISDTLTLRSAIRSTVADTLTARGAILAAIADTLGVRSSIRALAGDDLIARYGVRSPAGDSLAARWDVAAAVADALVSRWAITTSVGDSVLLRHAVLRLAAQDRTLRSQVRALASDSLSARWGVRTTTVEALALRYAVAALAGDALTASWNVLTTAAVSQDAVLRWALRSPAGDDLIVRGDVRALVADDLTARYGVSSLVGGSLELRSAIAALAGDDLTLRAALLELVADDLSLRGAIRAQTADTLALEWAVQEAMRGSTTLAYAIRELASATPVSLSWAARGRVHRGLGVRWPLRAPAGAALTGRWIVRMNASEPIRVLDDNVVRFSDTPRIEVR